MGAPSITQTVLAGSQFTGLVDAGLIPVGGLKGRTGSASIIPVVGLSFHDVGSVATWTITKTHPTVSANAVVVLSGTGDLVIESLPLEVVDSLGTAWGLNFTTSGMTGDGYLTYRLGYAEVST